jgi:hypothetical protein
MTTPDQNKNPEKKDEKTPDKTDDKKDKAELLLEPQEMPSL